MEIKSVNTNSARYGKELDWKNITDGDTVAPAYFEGGELSLMVEGELDGATVTWTCGADKDSAQKPIYSENAPTGVIMSEDTPLRINFKFSRCWIAATVEDGGQAQNIRLVARAIY